MSQISRIVIGAVVGLGLVMVAILGFQIAGPTVLNIAKYSQLVGALIGGLLALISVGVPLRKSQNVEPWIGFERTGWILVGLGCIAWAIGESFWRYYLSIGNPPFPSLADAGYTLLPPLVFLGLLLQPSSSNGRGRLLVVLDSLISMGSLLAIAWYLLLGALAQAPAESPLAKFLGLYYPISDVPLLACVVILLLRGQGRLYQTTARRTSLIIVGLGLCFFTVSDFIFHIQNNAGTYVDGTWVDLGWPLGMMTIGLAVYLRRFLPTTSQELIDYRVRRTERMTFGAAELVPYVLLGILSVVLVMNVLSADPGQVAIRPVLVFTTIGVFALVILRQIFTILDNGRLARRQADALARLELANKRIEEQARQIAERNTELEMGVTHLKDTQARLANGNLRARARLTAGPLLPLSASLNLMADRLMRLEQADAYSQRLTRTLSDLSQAIERYRLGGPLVIPSSVHDFPELNHLLFAMGLREGIEPTRPVHRSTPSSMGSPTQPQPPRVPHSGSSRPWPGSSARPGQPQRPTSEPLPTETSNPDATRRE